MTGTHQHVFSLHSQPLFVYGHTMTCAYADATNNVHVSFSIFDHRKLEVRIKASARFYCLLFTLNSNLKKNFLHQILPYIKKNAVLVEGKSQALASSPCLTI